MHINYLEKLNNLKEFDKSQRSSFSYWWNHWKAFNLTALMLDEWRWKFLFHDIEKPWLRLIMPYKKLQSFHRRNNNHHIEYKGGYDNVDWMALYIDWFCGRYTKYAAKPTVQQEAEYQISIKPYLKDVIEKYLKPYINYYAYEDSRY